MEKLAHRAAGPARDAAGYAAFAGPLYYACRPPASPAPARGRWTSPFSLARAEQFAPSPTAQEPEARRSLTEGVDRKAFSTRPDRLKRAALVQWVSDWRTVTSDGVAQRKSIDRVYSMIGRGTPAQVQVSEYYRNDPPYKRAQTVMVSVDVKAVYASGDKTWEVEWVEVARGITGDVQSEQRWKGSFTVAVNPPSDERLARVNPLGLFITNLSWSKVL